MGLQYKKQWWGSRHTKIKICISRRAKQVVWLRIQWNTFSMAFANRMKACILLLHCRLGSAWADGEIIEGSISWGFAQEFDLIRWVASKWAHRYFLLLSTLVSDKPSITHILGVSVLILGSSIKVWLWTIHLLNPTFSMYCYSDKLLNFCDPKIHFLP